MPPSPPPAPAPSSNPPSPNLTPSERDALLHWSLHGQAHDTTLQALKPRTLPPKNPKQISKPVSALWNVPLSSAQMVNLRRGFMPEEMEDKWLIYTLDGDDDDEMDAGDLDVLESENDQDDDGDGDRDASETEQKQEIMRVFMVRSWTGNLVYVIRILVLRDESRSGGKRGEEEMEGRILGISWEGDEALVRGQNEDVAKETAREVCRWILGVQLLPDVPRPRRGRLVSK